MFQIADASRSGVNIIAAGFANPLTSTTFSGTVGTDTHLQDIKAKSVEWVRVPVNPTGALAATDSTTEGAQIAYARDAIARCIRQGLKVQLSIHVNFTDTGWTLDDVAGDYPNGAKWKRYLAVLRKYAAMAKAFPQGRLAVLLYNEVSNSVSAANWNAMMREAQRAFRSVNPHTTMVVSGNQFSGPSGLAALVFAGFDRNTLFAFTPYTPDQFTKQGVAGAAFLSAYAGLSFPPIVSERSAMYTQIDASALSAPDKATTKGYVDAFLDTPMDDSYIDTDIAQVPTWITNQKVPAGRVISNEFGNSNNSGVKTSSRVRWTDKVRRKLTSLGIPSAVWHYDPATNSFSVVDGSYNFNQQLLSAMGLPQTASFETEATALFAAHAVQMSAARKTLVNNVIKLLKDAGIWTKLGYFNLNRCEDASQGIYNWKTAAGALTALGGSVTFASAAIGNGIVLASDGTARYLDTNYNLKDGGEGTDNIAAGTIKLSDDGLDSNRIDLIADDFSFGVDSHGASATAWLGGSGGFNSWVTAAQVQSKIKHTAFSITDSTHQRHFNNGSFYEQVSRTSAAVSTANVWMFGNGSFFSGGQISGAWIGKGLTDAEVAELYVICDYYEKAF